MYPRKRMWHCNCHSPVNRTHNRVFQTSFLHALPSGSATWLDDHVRHGRSTNPGGQLWWKCQTILQISMQGLPVRQPNEMQTPLWASFNLMKGMVRCVLRITHSHGICAFFYSYSLWSHTSVSGIQENVKSTPLLRAALAPGRLRRVG